MCKRGLIVAAAILLLSSTSGYAGICLRGTDIDHTEVKSDSVILFFMRTRQVYQNTLPQRCVGLRVATRGITYEPTNPATDELCGNFGTFRVNDTGQTCMWGDFTRLPDSKRIGG